MPIAKVQLPDGRIARFEVPEGTSPQQVLTEAENYFGRGVTQTPNFGPESMKESMAKAGEGMGFGKSVIAGLGTRINDASLRLKQILGFDLTPQEQADVAAGRMATGPVAGGRVAGDVALGLTALPTSIPGAAAAGAAQAFLTEPVLRGESAGQNAAMGAGGGALGMAAARGAQHLIRPITPSPDVQALLNEGIVPTVGESARSGGSRLGQFIGRQEEAATSLPFTGDVIGGARRRAGVEELNRAVFARATPKGIDPTQKTGREGLNETYDAISQVYSDSLSKIGIVRPDPTFVPDINRRVAQAVVGLPRDDITKVREMIQDIIGPRDTPISGAYTAEIAKRVDEDFGKRIRDFSKSGGSSDRGMREALIAAQGAWRDLIRRNAPDQATRDALDDANRAFANYVRAERAVAKPAAEHGEFNATQLAQAVRETSQGGARKSEYARGNALMEDLSDPAKAVLSTRLGESGTVPRALLGAAIIGGGAGGAAYGNEQLGGPSALTGLLAVAAGSPLLYSRVASRYMVGDLLPLDAQNVLAGLARASAPYVSALGRSRDVRPVELDPLR